MSIVKQTTWLVATLIGLGACASPASQPDQPGMYDQAILYRSADHSVFAVCDFLPLDGAQPIQTGCGMSSAGNAIWPGDEIFFGDCSTAEIACVRSYVARFAAPRGGVSENQTYQHEGVAFRVEHCSRLANAGPCDSAVISAECTDRQMCGTKEGTGAEIVAYFWLDRQRGVTAFTYRGERIAPDSATLPIAYLGALRVLVRDRGFLTPDVQLEPFDP